MGDKQRLVYLLKLLPWITLLASLGNLLVGFVTAMCGHHYFWIPSWLGVAGCTIFGIWLGWGASSEFDTGASAGGVAGGVMSGIVGGVIFGNIFSASFGITGFVVGGVALGVVFGLALGVVPSFSGGALACGTGGGLVGIILGVGGYFGLPYEALTAGSFGDRFLHWIFYAGWFIGFFTGWLVGGILSWLAHLVTGGVRSGALSGGVFGIAGGVAGGVVYVSVSAAAGRAAEGVVLGSAVGIAFALAFYLAFFRLGSYPLEALLAWLTHNAARIQPSASLRWWCRCPVAWNEVIWLPLPCAGKLLALAARQDREEGFKQIVFVAAERPLQRWAAVEALKEVVLADLEAGEAVTLSSSPERLAWTRQVSFALPEEFTIALPRFERAAQEASQFLTLSSGYRKADALKRAIGSIEALQRTLIASTGRYAPRLLQLANSWRKVLEAEQARQKQLAVQQRETPNPFIFGNPVDEPNTDVFAGRQDIVRQIEEVLLGARQSPALLLHGPRRVGKSSILKQLPRLLGPDFVPVVLDCQNPAVAGGEASSASLLRYLSASLSEGLHRRRVEVEPLATSDLVREPFAAFDFWLSRVEQGMFPISRALLCLDEYERLQRALDAGWGGDFLDALRHTLQHRPRFVLLFTGAHTFAELGPAWTDRFISARRVRVSFLQPDDVRPLLTKPIPEFDLTYAPGAVEAVIAATRCQPFLVQAVAFELVQYLNEQQRKEAAVADVETAITRALESGGEYFANVWSDAGKEGQAILREIAFRGVAADVRRLKSMTNGSQSLLTSAATAARKWLREHDVLDDSDQFAVPMMARWVRENAG